MNFTRYVLLLLGKNKDITVYREKTFGDGVCNQASICGGRAVCADKARDSKASGKMS